MTLHPRWSAASGSMVKVLLLPLAVYRRWISPGLPAACRYYPSCATYADLALRRHGLLRGSWLAVHRLVRCHPWTAGGVDHVPPPATEALEPSSVVDVLAGS